MISFFKDVCGYIIIAFVLVCLTSLTALVSPYLLGKAIDELSLFEHKGGYEESAVTEESGAGDTPVDAFAQEKSLNPSKMFLFIIFALSAVYVSDAASRFLLNFLMAGVSQKIVCTIRQVLFEHMQKLPVSYYDSYTHGDLMGRLSNDTYNISSVLGQAITQLMTIAITLTGTLMNGCTSFIIAHRLSTIVGADIIMVINNGRLAEIGNHKELLKGAASTRKCLTFN